MSPVSNREILRAVIDDLPPSDLEFLMKLFSGFIRDYQDRNLTAEEYNAHVQALTEDEWYE